MVVIEISAIFATDIEVATSHLLIFNLFSLMKNSVNSVFNNKGEFVYGRTLKNCGFTYLGGVATSAKMLHSQSVNVDTYCIYLSPSNLSGYNVCPNSSSCRDACLNTSGRVKVESLAGLSSIQRARFLKTRLFFEDKDAFMRLLIHEIEKGRKRAEKRGHEFSVRLNGTSDLSPLSYKLDGKNILELFPDIQFYDYTKVFYQNIENVHSRINLTRLYPNYDLTLSYTGYNLEDVLYYAEKGYRFAFVYVGKLPKTFCGIDVVDGDKYDARYYDAKGCAVGLKLKVTAKMVREGIPDIPFITKEGDDKLTY